MLRLALGAEVELRAANVHRKDGLRRLLGERRPRRRRRIGVEFHRGRSRREAAEQREGRRRRRVDFRALVGERRGDAGRRQGVQHRVARVRAEVAGNGHLALGAPLRDDALGHDRDVAGHGVQVGDHAHLQQRGVRHAVRGLVPVGDAALEQELRVGRQLLAVGLVVVIVVDVVVGLVVVLVGLGVVLVVLVVIALVVVVVIIVAVVIVLGFSTSELRAPLELSEAAGLQGTAHSKGCGEVADQDAVLENVGSLLKGLMQSPLLLDWDVHIRLRALCGELDGPALLQVACHLVGVRVDSWQRRLLRLRRRRVRLEVVRLALGLPAGFP
mmetsp:Transcript_51207/g.165895  ORF Transcript_51207/g.165895 Transcript_51207/m.165895 type:complete len:328 (+) Transcript_51207:2965-3948(+)